MRIALATCEDLPEWEVDDRPLHEAIRSHRIDFDQPCWSDSTVDWSGYDCCLIRTTWDYAHRRAEFVTWAEETAGLTRLLNPIDTIRWNTCKSYLRDLQNAGIPIIPTHWLESGERFDLKGILDDHGWERGFIKPRIGATARGTFRFDPNDESLIEAEHHLSMLLETEAALVQPYLSSVEHAGERSAIFIDGVLTHAVEKIPAPGDYRVQDDFGAIDRACRLDADESKLVEHVMRTLQANPSWTGEQNAPPLYARVDFLMHDAMPLVNEVELVEPSLFFRHCPRSAEALADALIARLRS